LSGTFSLDGSWEVSGISSISSLLLLPPPPPPRAIGLSRRPPAASRALSPPEHLVWRGKEVSGK